MGGGLAQLGEREAGSLEVAGSSPASSTIASSGRIRELADARRLDDAAPEGRNAGYRIRQRDPERGRTGVQGASEAHAEYRLHEKAGRALAETGGRRVYLGPYESPETRQG